MALARRAAFIISGQAGSANLGPHRIDGARRCDPDLAAQRRAAIAVAPHAPQRLIHEGRRNALKIGVRLGGESRPLLGIGTARPAGLARGRCICRHAGGADGEASRSKEIAHLASLARRPQCRWQRFNSRQVATAAAPRGLVNSPTTNAIRLSNRGRCVPWEQTRTLVEQHQVRCAGARARLTRRGASRRGAPGRTEPRPGARLRVAALLVKS